MTFIDVSVEEDDGALYWRLTGIYGEPSWDNKDRTYRMIRGLHASRKGGWSSSSPLEDAGISGRLILLGLSIGRYGILR